MKQNASKQKQLDEIARQIENCDECKKDSIGKAVPGEGNPDARVMFVGEAPGKQEAASGRPFIGRSGQLLRSFIRNSGLTEEDVYITSPVKYLPKRGTPSKKAIVHARELFFKQVDVINPEIMVLLGKTAIYAVLEEEIPVLKEHGKILERDGRKILVTLHPAAVLRFPLKFKALFQQDFEKLKQIIDTP